MNKQQRYPAIAGGFLAFLGMGHLIAGYVMGQSAENPPVMQDMKTHMIHFLGEFSLYQFFQGFSLMMGILLIFYGISLILSVRKHPLDLLSTFFHLGATTIIFVIALLYFHVVAYGFTFLAMAFLLASLPQAIRKTTYA